MRAAGRSVADRVIELVRTWWPVAAFLLPVLVVQAVWSARYDLAGHAADHLQSATPVFPMVFLSAVLLWALPVAVVVIPCCGCSLPGPSPVAWW